MKRKPRNWLLVGTLLLAVALGKPEFIPALLKAAADLVVPSVPML